VDDNSFIPQNGSVLTNGTVTWDWGTGTGNPHNVTFEDGKNNSSTKNNGTHQRTFTVTTSTTFRYRCTVHSSSFAAGMVGQIVVTP